MPKETLRVQRQYVEVPRIGGIRVVWVSLDGWETRTMCGTVNIGSVFDLDGFFQVGDQPPELLLDIILGDRPMAVENRIDRHLVLEVSLLKVGSLLLELLERVESSVFESELVISN
jgi:hypothetical protein